MRLGAADLNVHVWRDKEGELMDGKHGYHYEKWVLGLGFVNSINRWLGKTYGRKKVHEPSFNSEIELLALCPWT